VLADCPKPKDLGEPLPDASVTLSSPTACSPIDAQSRVLAEAAWCALVDVSITDRPRGRLLEAACKCGACRLTGRTRNQCC
jgi:hypothetical protein